MAAECRLRVASWNHRRSRHPRQLELLAALELDLLLLQDVSCASFRRVAPSFDWGWHSLDLRPPGPGEGGSRGKGTAILGGGRFAAAGRPRLIESVPAPERTLVADVRCGGLELTVASVNLVAGDVRDRNWGPSAKAAFFRELTSWLAGRRERMILGIDCNSPKVDHPDVARNEYWHHLRPDDQDEHLLLDPARAPHELRDLLRVYLAARPAELAAIVARRPRGPLAVSHVNVSSVRSERRYDFLLATPDVAPLDVRYLSDEVGLGSPGSISDHAIVVADVAVAG